MPLPLLPGGVPSLRISTAAGCNHRCSFCQVDGDYSSDFGLVQRSDLRFLQDTVARFWDLGVRCFTLTGGEPLLNPKVTLRLAEFVRGKLDSLNSSERAGSYLRINTNGVLLPKFGHHIASLFDLTKVSLHTLDSARYARITGSKTPREDHAATMDGVELLSAVGAAIRLQTVVGTFNADEVWKLVRYCDRQPGVTELKLFDISEYSELWRNNEPGHDPWRASFVNLESIEAELRRRFTFLGLAYSVGGYGNPMPMFETPDGLRIRLRRTDLGASYGEACQTCPARSFCGDGHCNLEVGPNRLIKVCRPKEGPVFAVDDAVNALELFRRTKHSINRRLADRTPDHSARSAKTTYSPIPTGVS